MAKMKTVQVPKAGADFEIVEPEIPQPGAGQVRIHALKPLNEKSNREYNQKQRAGVVQW